MVREPIYRRRAFEDMLLTLNSGSRAGGALVVSDAGTGKTFLLDAIGEELRRHRRPVFDITLRDTARDGLGTAIVRAIADSPFAERLDVTFTHSSAGDGSLDAAAEPMERIAAGLDRPVLISRARYSPAPQPHRHGSVARRLWSGVSAGPQVNIQRLLQVGNGQ